MGKSASPEHSETQQFSITTPLFVLHQVEELIGPYGTSRSDVIVHIINEWFTEHQLNIRDRLTQYKKFHSKHKRAQGK